MKITYSKAPASQYEIDGREAYIEKEDDQWVGWFADNESVEYIGDDFQFVYDDMATNG
jgi:hypothetical protein